VTPPDPSTEETVTVAPVPPVVIVKTSPTTYPVPAAVGVDFKVPTPAKELLAVIHLPQYPPYVVYLVL
jgi:hypothetical protein